MSVNRLIIFVVACAVAIIVFKIALVLDTARHDGEAKAAYIR